MAKQAERRAATTEAILKAGRRLFGERGFAATTIDDIADAAQVAKGAVYHHFATKEAVFEAVFNSVSRDLVADIERATESERDVLAAMVAGTQHYFAACAKGPTCQIILRDGPAVLGWERWREIDAEHFGGKFPARAGGCDGWRSDRTPADRAALAATAGRRSLKPRSPAQAGRMCSRPVQNTAAPSNRCSKRSVCGDRVPRARGPPF